MKKEFKLSYKGLAIAGVIDLVIMSFWYILELYQYGELQTNGIDTVVSLLYWIALMVGFSKWK